MVLEKLEVKEAIAAEHPYHGGLVNDLHDTDGVHVGHVDAQAVALLHPHLVLVEVAGPQRRIHLHQLQAIVVLVIVRVNLNRSLHLVKLLDKALLITAVDPTAAEENSEDQNGHHRVHPHIYQ